MTTSKSSFYTVCVVVLFSRHIQAQFGGGMGIGGMGGMGLYPYPYYGGGGMFGMGGGGCGGYPRPCYYPSYPNFGGGYPCYTSACCVCGGMGGGRYPYYGGGYPFYGNSMSTSYSSSSAFASGGYFG